MSLSITKHIIASSALPCVYRAAQSYLSTVVRDACSIVSAKPSLSAAAYKTAGLPQRLETCRFGSCIEVV